MGLTYSYLSEVPTVVRQVKTYGLECDPNAVPAPHRPLYVWCSPAREKSSEKPASCAGPHVSSSTGSTYKQEPALALLFIVTDSVTYNTHTERKYFLFQITNLMHNSFIFQQYVCYTMLLNMFQAACFSSSGGPIVSPQPLVSSPSVSSRTGGELSTCILYGCLQRVMIPEAVVIQLVLLRISSMLLETC